MLELSQRPQNTSEPKKQALRSQDLGITVSGAQTEHAGREEKVVGCTYVVVLVVPRYEEKEVCHVILALPSDGG